MTLANKLALYFQAARARRSLHWRGLPLLPKRSLHSRAAYNSFTVWITELHLPAAATIIDIGANHGDFAAAASDIFPAAKIFLAEPLPQMQRHLEQRIREQNLPWQLWPFALGHQPGRFTLHVDDHNDAVGSLAGFSETYLQANPGIRPTTTVECEVRTLDAAAADLRHIDLLKIDVEGFELEVLKGASAVLARTTAVIVEVSLIRKTGVTNPLLATLEILAGHGFSIVQIPPSLHDPREPWRPCEFNVLARRAAAHPVAAT